MYSHDRLVRKMELKRMKLEAEKKILRDALEKIVQMEDSFNQKETSVIRDIANNALEKTK